MTGLSCSLEAKLEIRLCWKSIRPEENRYRFYSLSVQQDLWGRPCVILRWGRIWGGSREKLVWIKTTEELKRLVAETHVNRSRHGYTLVQKGTKLHEQKDLGCSGEKS
jgi:predicted DNA-binding WGR domain protein